MKKLFLLPFLLFAQLTAVLAADEVTYPVDYTSKITAPNFSNAVAGVAEASSNLDDTGWINSSTLGGWMYKNYCAGHTSWNADIWTGTAGVLDVHQNVTGLPDGFYRISCLATTKHVGGKQRAYVATSARTAYSDTLTESKYIDDNNYAWDSLTTDRILVTDGNLTIGFTSTHDACSPNNSVGDFWCTHFHLNYYGPATDADMKDVLQNEFAGLIAQLGVLEADSTIASYPGIASTIDDYITNADDVDTSSVEALKTAIQSAKDLMTSSKQGATDAHALAALITKCTGIIASTSYPGLDDFTTALVAAKSVSTDVNSSKASDYASQLVTLTAAMKTYYLSQTADKDTPADYTFLISSPNFSKAAPGEAEASSNKDATGWVNGSTYTGGWQFLNYCAGHTCWNADLWSGNEIYLDIHQNLQSLPQGYYAVSCLGLTKHLSNTQHAFASTTSGTVYSPVLTEAKWNTVDETLSVWDSLTTEKILVTDGNLKVGFCSTREATSDQSIYSNSDFWCTHFHLYYYGAASTDEIQAMLNTKVTAAQAMADTMHFAVDKKALTDSIAIASSATTLDQINAAMVTLKSAVDNATKSEKKYSSIMASGKAIPTMRDSLAKSTTAYGAGNALVAFTYNEAKKFIEAATTSYTIVDPMVSKVNKYFNSYYPVFKEAMDSVAIFKSDKAKTVLTAVAKNQSAFLTADTLKSTAIVDSLTKILINEFDLCNGQNVYESNKSATDYTFMIKNPDAGGHEDNTFGWVINRGCGNQNTASGQHYLNDNKLRYFNSWNPKFGALNYNAYQVVNGIPNGTYTMKAACRTNGDKGTFIFASNGGTAKTDTTWTRILLQTYTNAETGETVNADASYGQIWQDATNAVTAAGGNYTDAQYAEAMANNNKGYGWELLSVEGVVVNNHQIIIGMSTDSLKTGEAFTGSWFSVVDFSLTKTADGDNTNWAGPIETSGINDAAIDEQNITRGVFNLAGVKMNSNANLPKGIYIIKSGKKTSKVLVK